MKYFLDEDGNLVEKPENLREHLEVRSPELADEIDRLWEWKMDLNAYRFFLYSLPSEEELQLPEQRGPDWEKYIQAVDSQAKLEDVLSTIDTLKNAGRDITSDKVVVVRSDRPFYDTLLIKDGKRIGNAEGWVGLVESYDLTDVENASFFSHDGKIHQRFVLKEARRLSEEELKQLAGANILYAIHHHDTEALNACLKKLEASSLGSERVLVYDKFPNIDHAVLTRVLKEDEKQVAHISAEEADRIDLLPYYGPRQIPGSHLTAFRSYKSSKYKRDVLVAEDPRKISEIYMQIKGAFENKIKQQFGAMAELEIAHVFVAKLMKDFITPEQREKADNASLFDVNKWYKKFIDEQGLEITDKTIIGVSVWGPQYKSADMQATNELIGILEDVLRVQGYRKTRIGLAYGYGKRCNGRLTVDTASGFGTNPDLYAGELVIKFSSGVVK